MVTKVRVNFPSLKGKYWVRFLEAWERPNTSLEAALGLLHSLQDPENYSVLLEGPREPITEPTREKVGFLTALLASSFPNDKWPPSSMAIFRKALDVLYRLISHHLHFGFQGDPNAARYERPDVEVLLDVISENPCWLRCIAGERGRSLSREVLGDLLIQYLRYLEHGASLDKIAKSWRELSAWRWPKEKIEKFGRALVALGRYHEVTQLQIVEMIPRLAQIPLQTETGNSFVKGASFDQELGKGNVVAQTIASLEAAKKVLAREAAALALLYGNH